MKGIMLLVVGVVLLLAAAGGGYYAYTKYFTHPAEEEKAAKPPPPPPPVYVRIPPFVVPVVGAERVEQVITMVVSLQVKDQFAAEAVSARMARVTDTFMTTVYGAMDEGDILHGSMVNVAGLKKRLQTVSDQLFGKDVVKDVLVQTVLQRRL